MHKILIIQEIFSGAQFQGRSELDKLSRVIQSGDAIVFDSVSRVFCNADEDFALYETILQSPPH